MTRGYSRGAADRQATASLHHLTQALAPHQVVGRYEEAPTTRDRPALRCDCGRPLPGRHRPARRRLRRPFAGRPPAGRGHRDLVIATRNPHPAVVGPGQRGDRRRHPLWRPNLRRGGPAVRPRRGRAVLRPQPLAGGRSRSARPVLRTHPAAAGRAHRRKPRLWCGRILPPAADPGRHRTHRSRSRPRRRRLGRQRVQRGHQRDDQGSTRHPGAARLQHPQRVWRFLQPAALRRHHRQRRRRRLGLPHFRGLRGRQKLLAGHRRR